MPRGTTVTVKAVLEKPDDKGTASPVANAKVVVLQDDLRAYAIGRTNDQGVAEFQGLPGGKYTVNALAAGVVSQGEEVLKVDPNQLQQEVTVHFEPADTRSISRMPTAAIARLTDSSAHIGTRADNLRVAIGTTKTKTVIGKKRRPAPSGEYPRMSCR